MKSTYTKHLTFTLLSFVCAFMMLLTSCGKTVQQADGSGSNTPAGGSGDTGTGGDSNDDLDKDLSFESLISGDGDVLLTAHKAPSDDGITGVNDEQYGYLKQGHIDLLEWDLQDYHEKEDCIAKTLEMCEKYGIGILICDSTWRRFTSLPDEGIISAFEKYKDYACVWGYHVIDEPSDANQYARIVQLMQQVKPGAIAQINFFPIGALADVPAQMEDFLSVVGKGNLSYLSYDQYPFSPEPNSVPQMFNNMDVVRNLGLKYDVDTALYIQAVGSTYYGYRQPTPAEIRYHMSAALAYGYKNLKFYTRCTTPYNPDKYFDAIIGHDGKPSENFEGVCENNADVKKVSRILGNLDAMVIYHNGRNDASTDMLPSDWYVQATDKSDFMVSLMVDRNTGRNYLMFVNKDFQNDSELSVKLNGVNGLYDITGGTLEAADINDGILKMKLKAGGFALYALNSKDNLLGQPTYDIDTGENINYALGKPIYASDSVGYDGMYACKANDGICTSTGTSRGWMFQKMKSLREKEKEAWLAVDMLRPVSVHQVSIYPYSLHPAEHKGDYFPKDFTVQYSADGVTWQDALKVENYEYNSDNGDAAVFEFESVEARYLRLYFNSLYTTTITSAKKDVVAISEIEIR